MNAIEVDLAVIGFGKGGKTLVGALAKAGKRVVLIEQSDQMYGGTCINIACVPTKALVHQAELRRASDSAADWFTASVRTRDTLTAKLRARNHAMLTEVDTVTVVDGRARFVAPREVEVTAGQDRLRITGRTVVINTGTVPLKYLSISTMAATEICEYPDSGKFLAKTRLSAGGRTEFRHIGRAGETVDYWEDEPGA